jgi:hypothetical protein
VKRGVLIALLLVLVLPAAPALGKKSKTRPKPLGPVVTVTATGNTAGENQTSTATATCPKVTRKDRRSPVSGRKQVVGGGFGAPFVPGSAVVVHDSFRSSPRSWTVTGLVVDGTGAVTAHAYCRNRKGYPITDVSASVSFTDSGEIHGLAPSCPSGKLIAGGFQATTIPGDAAVIYPLANQASKRGAWVWAVTGIASQDGARTLTAHAYCMANVRAPILAEGYSTETVGQFGAVASTATCLTEKPTKKGKERKRKPLFAGGFHTTPFNRTPDFPSMIFTESHATPTGGWVASATNRFDATAGVSVYSQGICLGR